MKPTKQYPLPPNWANLRRGLLAAMSIVATTPVFAQATTPPQTTSSTSVPTPAEVREAGDEETIVLSPFTVDASQDKGYFAENTLAGSRLNTKISDLGASISVVTKQQMEDTASVDINDVFRYEINTEGSSTYTPQVLSLRSDGVVDTNAGYTHGGNGIPLTNATSNRVRGIGVPSSAINYYPSIAQIPMDAYNIQSLEISRGPNSMLFGMGSPAGIVNQNTAQAVINRDSANLTLRVDDSESFRASMSFNKGLIKDKLAVYGAFLYDDRQFERKPSYDTTRRQYGAITYQPFRKTKIRANIEGYSNDNRRPNSLTPRDFVTEWNLAGKPVYDPLTKQVTKTATGEVIGPFILDAASPYANQVRSYIESRPDFDPAKWNAARTQYGGVNIFGEGAMTTAPSFTSAGSILYVPGINWTNQSRTTMQIADGQLVNWFQPLGNQQYRRGWGTPTNPAANQAVYPARGDVWANPEWADIHNRYYTSSNGWTNNGPQGIIVGGYKYPSVTDKQIYDWEKVNVTQMNFGEEKNTNYNVELEQEILSNLHLSAGWFRQDFESISNYTVAQLNVATLFVDTNARLPDGTPNPYLGKVYVEDTDPDQFVNMEEHDHFRAMLAYTPDFTRNDNWTRWLGRHQFLGLWSKQDTMRTFYRKRLHFVDSTSQIGKYRYMANQNDNADGTPTGWNRQTTSVRRTYYLSSPGDLDGTVTRSSGAWDHTQYSGDIKVYNYETGEFETINMTQEFIDHDAGTGRNERKIESMSAGMTNYLWNDRIITTFGVRKDDYKARSTTNAAILAEDKSVISPAMTNAEKFVNGVYQTDKVFNRWNRWDELDGTTRTLGGVFKPFTGWSNIDRRAASGSLWWQFIRDLGFSYNKSDNFNAPDVAQVDAFGTPLPKPTGEGKDYGIQFSLFDDKLFARITWFEASNENERTNPGSSISRLTGNVDTTIFRAWARTIAMINMGMDPRISTFGQNLTPAEEDQIRAAATEAWGQPYLYYDNLPGGIGATRDAEAEGVEVQINYNPLPNWTMKFTGGKQETVYNNVLKEFDAWFAHRNPVWQNAKAADYLLPQYQQFLTYTREGGRQVDLTNFWQSYGYVTEVRLDDPFGNFSVEDYYNINVRPQYDLARDLNGQAAPGQRRYRASFLTNYAFDKGPLTGFSVGASQRWEDKAIIGYYGRSSGANANPDVMDVSDVSRPIYDSDNWYTDVWVAYTRKILNGKTRMKLQLNVIDAFEDGGLKVTAVNYDGSPYSYRIVDSRKFIFTAAFDF